jgi:hypothetical protein
MLVLVRDYLSAAQAAADHLRNNLGVEDLLRARRLGATPKEGWVDRERQIHYSFHGIGCTVEAGGDVIDFDFGPGGRVGGFDLWRLGRFLESRRQDYPGLRTIEQQKRAFSRLVEEGVIVSVDEMPSSHLFRLRDVNTSAG